MDWRPSSSAVRRASLTSSLQKLLGQSLPNLVCSICRVRRQEIVNFMTPTHPKGRLFWGKKCKIDVYLKKSSSLLPGIDQTNQICSNDDQGRVYQIVNFMTSGVGVLVLGCGHISRIVKMHYYTPANQVAGVYSDPYVRPFIRLQSVRPSP